MLLYKVTFLAPKKIKNKIFFKLRVEVSMFTEVTDDDPQLQKMENPVLCVEPLLSVIRKKVFKKRSSS